MVSSMHFFDILAVSRHWGNAIAATFIGVIWVVVKIMAPVGVP